jgi:excinuclease ABC subunit A
MTDLDQLDPKKNIIIKGARVNNLKNLSVAIPRNKLVVVTGVSGSGKSSLAFDTLFAEGQRMYVESLSSYARQFLGRMEKPEVDYIRGVSPAIAIEQKVSSKNPRSTVGTTTEIYDYFKLLFARLGKTYSPVTGKEVKKHTVSLIVDAILKEKLGAKFMILAPLHIHEGRSIIEELNILLQKGYTRIRVNETIGFIEDFLEQGVDFEKTDILIDRGVTNEEEELKFRLADSIQTALYEGVGECTIVLPKISEKTYSDQFELDGIKFEEPTANFFSFNNPYGACQTCEGFGHVLGIDPDLVIPNKDLSIYEGAIAPWKGEKMGEFLVPLVRNGIKFDFPIHRPYKDLSDEEKAVLWTGNEFFEGLDSFFKFLASQTHKIQYRVMLSRYRGRTDCPDCKGTRLRKDASYVKINGKSIQDLVLLPIEDALVFFNQIELTPYEQDVAKRILNEIKNRLGYLLQVGLSYLTLNRLTGTLSGGEFQRIKLATSLGSALVGSMYILDEPSIGLHPRDTSQLIDVLKTLRDLGNTVIVVEHEEDVMRAADQIIDIGPDAGTGGGELIFQGSIEDIKHDKVSYTGQYLNELETITTPATRRKWNHFISVIGASENNLKDLEVKFPLNTLTVVTGVSGSGKSTLIKKVLYPALKKLKGDIVSTRGKFKHLGGELERIHTIEFVDQNPIGKSSRSNPVTYVKAYDAIRNLYADLPLSKQRGYKPSFFSFNVDGGRCDNCKGEGEVKIEMQFMADLHLNCEVCNGQRFKEDLLEAKYKDTNISQVLQMTVSDSILFFADTPKIVDKLKPLEEVGLGYIRLGQSSNSLSGGEAQRVKLASFIGKGEQSSKPAFFVFDEPTTGLHFHDIQKLLTSFNALIKQGHSVLVIEHNLEVIKMADWIIDLGPEGGDKGGYLVFEGTPEQLVKSKKGYTSRYLKEKIKV